MAEQKHEHSPWPGRRCQVADLVVSEEDIVAALGSGQAEIGRLGIAPGTPVAEHVRTGYTAEDRAVRVMVSIVPGDMLILQYTVPT